MAYGSALAHLPGGNTLSFSLKGFGSTAFKRLASRNLLSGIPVTPHALEYKIWVSAQKPRISRLKGERLKMRCQILILMGLVLLPVARVQCTTQRSSTREQSANGEPKTGSPSGSVAPNDYRIGPQDVIRIDVWKEPEITRTIPVRPDGKISLPLLNDVQAAGLTAMELAGNIREALTKYLTGPQVTVTVTEINSRRVFVTGEVAHVGALSLLPNMTVLQALSSTGGFTAFARRNKIYVLRSQGGKQIKLFFNYKEVIKGNHSEQDILLQPGDVIVVP